MSENSLKTIQYSAIQITAVWSGDIAQWLQILVALAETWIWFSVPTL